MSPVSAGRQDSPAEHVTPYDRFGWSDSEVERLLATGKHEHELTAYFGAAEYRALRRLAKRCKRSSPAKGAPPVFVVPGIMGSQLGLRRAKPLPQDVLWLDPIDIGVGRLAALRLPPRAPIVPLGVVLYSYLRLKLHLRAGGFAPVFHDYDWRLRVEELGAALAQRIRATPGKRIMIVAHSMGGLVSRAALTQPGTDRVERVVLLGTPNLGSFAPLQALRGTYSVVRKIARLVSADTAEALAENIFNTFPSLYQMLPVSQRTAGTDLFDRAQWPASGPQPDPALLRSARAIQSRMAPGDERMCPVVGIGQETITSVSRRANEFVYTITRHGDGTVPAASASLPGARNHYVPVPHSELTRDPVVAAAVNDLLHRGTTKLFPSKWRSDSRAEARISDTQLRRMHTGKVDWAGLLPEERREFLQTLNEPPKLRLRVPGRRKSPRGKRP
ncbi:MAG TPA: alpha/beta fold hydrolase [Steroidobacteraceae bacterium]|nr:alpha/beta fold hydrolase [Steroidobacteraceae bacterium]